MGSPTRKREHGGLANGMIVNRADFLQALVSIETMTELFDRGHLSKAQMVSELQSTCRELRALTQRGGEQ